MKNSLDTRIQEKEGLEMEKTDLIRLAAFLYSEKEGIKKKTTVLKRIIEAVFLKYENRAMDISEMHNNILM